MQLQNYFYVYIIITTNIYLLNETTSAFTECIRKCTNNILRPQTGLDCLHAKDKK